MAHSFNVSLHANYRIILCTLNLASVLFAHFFVICLNPSKKIGHKAWPLSSSLLFPQNLFHDYVARLPYDHGFMSLSFSTLQFTYILPGGIKNIFSTWRDALPWNVSRTSWNSEGNLPYLISANFILSYLN